MRESLKALELDACLTVSCLLENPERDVIVGVVYQEYVTRTII